MLVEFTVSSVLKVDHEGIVVISANGLTLAPPPGGDVNALTLRKHNLMKLDLPQKWKHAKVLVDILME